MGAIETRDLTKYYGDTRGIEGLSLEIDAGEIFGFLGPNGAGKTTTIRTLLGFLSPTRGEARVLGHDVTDERDLLAAKRRLGYVPAELGFEEDVTGRRLLDHHARLKGDERSDELLELFDAPVDREIGAYSTGNRKKLALVQAFMHDPDLVIMDEPTSGLDPLLQERCYEFLRAERESGTTIFFSSHVLSEVRKVCDRVGIVRNGRLATVEGVETLLRRGGKVVRVRVAEDVSAVDVDLEGAHEVTAGDGVHFTFTGDYDDLIDWLDGYRIRELDVAEAPLEDVFMRFYDEDVEADSSGERAAEADSSGDRAAEEAPGGAPDEPADASATEEVRDE